MSDRRAVNESVIVVGAGIAGLAAARTLAEAGRSVILLEARHRIGGRIHTVAAATGGLPVELGAEFIHGLPPELIRLVDEAGLTRFEMEGEVKCSQGGGRGLGSCGEQQEAEPFFDALSNVELPRDDMSFDEFVAWRGLGPEATSWARNYVEGFNAADADRISIRSLRKQQAAEDAISGERGFRVVEGYAEVPSFLLRCFEDAGGQLFLSSAVRSVDWMAGTVRVVTADGRVFEAGSILLTLPLGVLQARHVTFSPEPERILAAADQLAMGQAIHLVYEFDGSLATTFRGLQDVGFVLAPEATPPTWWTTNPRPSPLLTGWIAGGKATSLAIESLPDTGLATLAGLLDITLDEVQKHLVGSHLHDWLKDPFSLGAYTYVPKGAIDASEELSIPVECTLFFAGEHSDTSGHWGTVHGALRSGYRAAAQMLAVL